MSTFYLCCRQFSTSLGTTRSSNVSNSSWTRNDHRNIQGEIRPWSQHCGRKRYPTCKLLLLFLLIKFVPQVALFYVFVSLTWCNIIRIFLHIFSKVVALTGFLISLELCEPSHHGKGCWGCTVPYCMSPHKVPERGARAGHGAAA